MSISTPISFGIDWGGGDGICGITGDDDDFVLDSGLAGAGGDFGDGREELGGESFDAVFGF